MSGRPLELVKDLWACGLKVKLQPSGGCRSKERGLPKLIESPVFIGRDD